jgi:hypothetical protein
MRILPECFRDVEFFETPELFDPKPVKKPWTVRKLLRQAEQTKSFRH